MIASWATSTWKCTAEALASLRGDAAAELRTRQRGKTVSSSDPIAPWWFAPRRQPPRTFVARITAAIVVAAVAGLGASTTSASAALLHDDPCHLQHSCPSDDASYIWFEPVSTWTAVGWWCVDPASPEYNATNYTRVVQYDNRTFVCEPAGITATVDIVFGIPAVPTAEPQYLAPARIPPQWKNCAQVKERYPHGIGRPGAHDKTSGSPVTTFKRSTPLFRTAIAANAGLDRDHDGIACEAA